MSEEAKLSYAVDSQIEYKPIALEVKKKNQGKSKMNLKDTH